MTTTRNEGNGNGRADQLSQEWRRYVTAKLDALEQLIQSISVKLEGLSSSYQASHSALEERVTRLEASPQRLLAWISLGISALMVPIGCGSVLLLGLSTIVGLVYFVATHLH